MVGYESNFFGTNWEGISISIIENNAQYGGGPKTSKNGVLANVAHSQKLYASPG